MTTLGSVGMRLYESLLMPSRLEVYRQLLDSASMNSYRMLSVLDFHRLNQAGEFDPTKRYLVLRHDIDTDASAAREFLAIEREIGASASHYFRLCTLDIDLMKEIESSGSEASYHYEEIATVAKEERLRTREEIQAEMPRIRDRFARNYRWLRRVSGLPLRTVASHGDFINRKISMTNSEILRDPQLREELGIELETYDEEAERRITSRHSDRLPPAYWKPRSPFKAIEEGSPVVYVLTHPRHFRCRVADNLSSDLRRLYEGVCHRFGLRSEHRAMRRPLHDTSDDDG